MKRKTIFLIIIILLLIVGGVFWWSSRSKREIEGSYISDYTIRETEEGEMVKSEEAGLKIRLPEEWRAQSFGESVDFFNPEEFSPEGSLQKKRCVIYLKTSYTKLNFDELEEKMKNEFSDLLSIKSEEYRSIKVNNQLALEAIFETTLDSQYINVWILAKDKIYKFLSPIGNLDQTEDKERCTQGFYTVLEEVLIE